MQTDDQTQVCVCVYTHIYACA
eukprot:COSAG04_NODE_28049_length_278_cov_0.581006_1_plen_21_part_01